MTFQDRPYTIVKHKCTDIGRFCIVQDTIEIDRKKYPYSYLTNDSFVVILPIYMGQIVYIHQYRHAFNEWIDELPGGGINDGEKPEDAARRELLEETGLSGNLIKLCEMPGGQGTSSGICHIYAAFCENESEPINEPTELIEIRKMTEENFGRVIRQGKLHHLAAIVAWYYYQLRKEQFEK